MRYFILMLMAIMSVSICTAGGFTHSESIHHVPKIEKYKLKKEKKERKLTGKQIAKIVIAVLLAAIIGVMTFIDTTFYLYFGALMCSIGMIAASFHPNIKKQAITLFIIIGLLVFAIGMYIMLGKNSSTILLVPIWLVFSIISMLLLLLFLSTTEKIVQK